jgi:hypothetical protein
MSAGKKKLTEGGNWKGKKENEFRPRLFAGK